MFEESSEGAFVVVRNDEEQYSIWPADQSIPAGWYPAGPVGPRQECLAYIRPYLDPHAPVEPAHRVRREVTTWSVRLAVWSCPRNISSALMRFWDSRPDTVVVDEPLPLPVRVRVQYQKHMAHHLLPAMSRDWISRLPSTCSTNVTCGHSTVRQYNRRTDRSITSGRLPTASSVTCRVYRECSRTDAVAHLGHRAGNPSRVRAETRTSPSSARTPSTSATASRGSNTSNSIKFTHDHAAVAPLDRTA